MFVLHYKKYNAFYTLPVFEKLQDQGLLAKIFQFAVISILAYDF